MLSTDALTTKPSGSKYGVSACLKQSGWTFSSLAVELAASFWLGTWRDQDTEPPSLSRGGLAAPVPTSLACQVRMRLRMRKLGNSTWYRDKFCHRRHGYRPPAQARDGGSSD